MTQNSYIKIGSYNYSEQDIIGKGSFGKVYRGKNNSSGDSVAIKVVNIGSDPNKASLLMRMIKNEVEALKRVQSENVIQFLDYFHVNENVFIITEYCHGKDLRNYLTKHKILSEKKAVEILQQVINAFKELCRRQVLHRDIKPANILLHNGMAKLADFGFAKILDFSFTDYGSTMVSIVGTPLYMSPQLLEKAKYSTKSDIWSIGIIFYEMMYGRAPWPGKDPASYLKAIKTNPITFDREICNISSEAEDFIKECLKVEEKDRIGWNEVFDHPLILGTKLQLNEEDIIGVEGLEYYSPEAKMQEYQTRAVNPSSLMKVYQDKILQASRDIMFFESTKTTIDQKLKMMNQLSLSCALMKGNLYAPGSRSFNMSFNEALSSENPNLKSQGDGLFLGNANKPDLRERSSERDPSPAPLQRKKTHDLKKSNSLAVDTKGIEGPLFLMKNKIVLMNEFYNIISKKEDNPDNMVTRFMLLLTMAKTINMWFKNLSNQIFNKKFPAKSVQINEFVESANYKKFLVFCETEKKHFENILKKTCRKIFELGSMPDKEKDEVLEYHQEISNENDENYLLQKVSEFSTLLLALNDKKSKILENSTNPSNVRSYYESLYIGYDDSLFGNPKLEKAEEVLVRLTKIKEELKLRIQNSS